MRALGLVVALCAALAQAQQQYGSEGLGGTTRHQHSTLVQQYGGFLGGTYRHSGSTTAFFEFAPTSGAGMGSACACTTPTGAKGEALVFSRASSGACLKTTGTAPQAIANGDMVTCTSGQPRVMPGTDGTSVNGLLVEGARTNAAIQSQAMDNVVWAHQGTVTVTADQTTAPDGTLTADRVQFAAGNGNALDQTGLNAGSTVSASIFIKGNGTSGAIDMAVFNSVAAYVCVTCSFNSTSWTRCATENVASHAATPTFVFGNWNGNGTGCTHSAAADVFIWGAQDEVGALASSYIATTSAAVTRVAELADVGITPTLTSGYSIAANVTNPSGANTVNARWHGTAGNLAAGNASASSSYDDSFGMYAAETTATAPSSVVLATSYTDGSRWASYVDGANLGACKDGVCNTVAVTYTPPTWTRIRLGCFDGANGYIFGVIKRVCLDPLFTRCR